MSITFIVAFLSAIAAAASVDGGKLAYVRDGNIWVKHLPDGSSQQITAHGSAYDPRWSPSGLWLSFTEGSVSTVIPATGGEPVLSFPETYA